MKVSVEWLCERPAGLGGAWAIGCRFCGNLLTVFASQHGKSARFRTNGQRVNTKWARCDVRSLSGDMRERVDKHKAMMKRATRTCKRLAFIEAAVQEATPPPP